MLIYLCYVIRYNCGILYYVKHFWKTFELLIIFYVCTINGHYAWDSSFCLSGFHSFTLLVGSSVLFRFLSCLLEIHELIHLLSKSSLLAISFPSVILARRSHFWKTLWFGFPLSKEIFITLLLSILGKCPQKFIPFFLICSATPSVCWYNLQLFVSLKSCLSISYI